MSTFSKYNNPNKRRKPKKLSRTDADIIAAKQMFDDRSIGIELPLSYYDHLSDIMSGNPSRGIYKEEE